MTDDVATWFQLSRSSGMPLVHTGKSGAKLHIEACPHLSVTSALVAATPESAEGRDLCESCRPELEQRGRTYYDTLERGMEALPVPVHNRALVRDFITGNDIRYSRVWIPASSQYVALGGPDQLTTYVNKYSIWHDYKVTEFPGFARGGGGGSTSSETLESVPCPTCFMQLPATGVCDTCS
jgi:hypothetical protein